MRKTTRVEAKLQLMETPGPLCYPFVSKVRRHRGVLRQAHRLQKLVGWGAHFESFPFSHIPLSGRNVGQC